MPPEFPPNRTRRGTLLENVDVERLIRLSEKTTRIKVADKICELVAQRFEQEQSVENQMALERVLFKRDIVLEVNLLEADLKAPDDEDIALEEAVNEALFKPFGNK
jgi:lipopolysaccharide biosynthesis regulator YciM